MRRAVVEENEQRIETAMTARWNRDRRRALRASAPNHRRVHARSATPFFKKGKGRRKRCSRPRLALLRRRDHGVLGWRLLRFTTRPSSRPPTRRSHGRGTGVLAPRRLASPQSLSCAIQHVYSLVPQRRRRLLFLSIPGILGIPILSRVVTQGPSERLSAPPRHVWLGWARAGRAASHPALGQLAPNSRLWR